MAKKIFKIKVKKWKTKPGKNSAYLSLSDKTTQKSENQNYNSLETSSTHEIADSKNLIEVAIFNTLNHFNLSKNYFDENLNQIRELICKRHKNSIFRQFQFDMFSKMSEYNIVDLLILCIFLDCSMEFPNELDFLTNIFHLNIESKIEFDKNMNIVNVSGNNINQLKEINKKQVVVKLKQTLRNFSLFGSDEFPKSFISKSNKKRKNTEIKNENEKSEILNNNVKLSYDIDGINGIIELSDMINCGVRNLNVRINVVSQRKIRTKNEVCVIREKAVNIKNLQNIYLGQFYAFDSPISLFIIFKEEIKHHDSRVQVFCGNIVEFLNTTMGISQSYLNAKRSLKYTNSIAGIEKLSCDINEEVLEKIIYHFKEQYGSDILIFIEGYGMKAKTHSPSILELCGKISSFLTVPAMRRLNFDVCVNLFPGKGNFMYINNSFYKEMNVAPNYHLFFTKLINNCHKNTVKIIRDKIKMEFGPIKKVNFYSTFEDEVVQLRHLNFVPKFTVEKIRREFCGHKIFKARKVSGNNTAGSIYESLNLIENESSYPYRLEVSVNTIFIIDVLSFLSAKILRSGVSVISNAEILPVVKDNITLFLNFFKVNTVNEIFSSIVAEVVLVQQFLKGTNNIQFLPSSIGKNIMLNYITESLPKRIESLDALELNNYDPKEQKQLIMNLVKYEKKFKKEEVFLLDQMLDFYCSAVTYINLLDLYIVECNTRFNVNTSNFSLSVLDNIPENSMSITSFIAKYFTNIIKKYPFFFSCAAGIFRQVNNVSNEVFVQEMTKTFILFKIEYVFNLELLEQKRFSKKHIYLKCSQDHIPKSLHLDLHKEIVGEQNVALKLKHLFYKKKFLRGERSRVGGRRPWTFSEKVRLLYCASLANASIREASKAILNFFKFGFIFTRAESDLVDTLKGLKKRPQILGRFLDCLYDFDPHSFTLHECCEYIKSLTDIQMNDDELDIFQKIVFEQRDKVVKMSPTTIKTRLEKMFGFELPSIRYSENVEIMQSYEENSEVLFNQININATGKQCNTVIFRREMSEEANSDDVEIFESEIVNVNCIDETNINDEVLLSQENIRVENKEIMCNFGNENIWSFDQSITVAKLRKKFDEREFVVSHAFKEVFTSKKRPSVLEFRQFIDFLVELRILEIMETKVYCGRITRKYKFRK